jgi:hypothetical protein
MNPFLKKLTAFLEKSAATEDTTILPTAGAGETYVGIIIPYDGSEPYHLMLMNKVGHPATTWEDAVDFANNHPADIDLPTIQEAKLLHANTKTLTGKKYWTSEPHAAYQNCAWVLDGTTGIVGYGQADRPGIARLVRRISI